MQDGEIHVCRIDLARLPDAIVRFAPDLSADERARAARFRRPDDAARYVAGRSVLRTLLGRYLARPRDEVSISYGEFGKPFAGGDVEFSVGHAGRFVVVAFAWRRPIGVDVEPHSARDSLLVLSERFFSADEHAELARLRGDERVRSFYRLWTLKEAMLKARGDGLRGIREIDATAFRLLELTLAPDYSAALAWFDPEPSR